jgi:hypothetical protein
MDTSICIYCHQPIEGTPNGGWYIPDRDGERYYVGLCQGYPYEYPHGDKFGEDRANPKERNSHDPTPALAILAMKRTGQWKSSSTS